MCTKKNKHSLPDMGLKTIGPRLRQVLLGQAYQVKPSQAFSESKSIPKSQGEQERAVSRMCWPTHTDLIIINTPDFYNQISTQTTAPV